MKISILSLAALLTLQAQASEILVNCDEGEVIVSTNFQFTLANSYTLNAFQSHIPVPLPLNDKGQLIVPAKSISSAYEVEALIVPSSPSTQGRSWSVKTRVDSEDGYKVSLWERSSVGALKFLGAANYTECIYKN
jgi:hypothetical protein